MIFGVFVLKRDVYVAWRVVLRIPLEQSTTFAYATSGLRSGSQVQGTELQSKTSRTRQGEGEEEEIEDQQKPKGRPSISEVGNVN